MEMKGFGDACARKIMGFVWEKGKNEMDWDTAIRYPGGCKDMMLGNQQ
jgi:hypothetical protein